MHTTEQYENEAVNETCHITIDIIAHLDFMLLSRVHSSKFGKCLLEASKMHVRSTRCHSMGKHAQESLRISNLIDFWSNFDAPYLQNMHPCHKDKDTPLPCIKVGSLAIWTGGLQLSQRVHRNTPVTAIVSGASPTHVIKYLLLLVLYVLFNLLYKQKLFNIQLEFSSGLVGLWCR